MSEAVIEIGPQQRLGATSALAAIVIGIIVLGVGFVRENAAPVVPTLDVILTETRTDNAPKDADFLAQATNEGGGDREEARRPREEQLAIAPRPEPAIAPIPIRAQAPKPSEVAPNALVTTESPSADIAQRSQESPDNLPKPLPTGEELLDRSLEMARLASEVERKQELYAKRPKRKFISASTREYEYAAYMRAWVGQVERVGNANYPEKARAQKLTGRLVMTVTLRRDGTVANVVINKKSPYPVLDLAAIRIVELAQPYPVLPKTAENIDELLITRTWEFKDGTVDGG